MTTIKTNITDFAQALRDNFKNITNKKYIRESISWHYWNGYITCKEADNLIEEFNV